ncbi:hypothetical protein MZD04_gp387 [Pseudomonas phage Psa21]|uniref:Lipoprotein n=1 Tax=Pseudomonas phage Psa21 TaxID=2530023 RepID=A0A481W692_9CAUD|nr:hypothetical protein MZD04_gp387 [Pseudomonas phage Psa21]QBJ02913.1 hypothetical protein PSA21_387 [Pseudomonas phage Psa21]
MFKKILLRETRIIFFTLLMLTLGIITLVGCMAALMGVVTQSMPHFVYGILIAVIVGRAFIVSIAPTSKAWRR